MSRSLKSMCAGPSVTVMSVVGAGAVGGMFRASSLEATEATGVVRFGGGGAAACRV